MSKQISANVIVERDVDGGYLLSVPGVRGLHADGDTMEEAIKNLNEVLELLSDYNADRGYKDFVSDVAADNSRIMGMMNVSLVHNYTHA